MKDITPSGLVVTEIITTIPTQLECRVNACVENMDDTLEWHHVSQAMPVVIKGVLNYTVTVSAGVLV